MKALGTISCSLARPFDCSQKAMLFSPAQCTYWEVTDTDTEQAMGDQQCMLSLPYYGTWTHDSDGQQPVSSLQQLT